MSDPAWLDNRFDRYNLIVGRIATLWAHVEFAVNDLIWDLANIDASAGACITAQIVAFNSRMRTLIALIDFRGGNEALLRDFKRFSNEADEVGRRRNRYVHDPVGIDPEGKILRVQITADRKLDSGFREADYVKMDEVYRQIHEVHLRFVGLRTRVLVELPPWPRKQFEQSPGAIVAGRGQPEQSTPSPHPQSSRA